MKFIHAADIHLDSPLRRLAAYEGAPVDEIRQASRRAFENLIDLALDASVSFVLIAGDLFDGDWKDYNTGLYFVRQIHRLADAGIRLFIVSGNHDAAGPVTKTLPYPANTHLFAADRPETIIIEASGVAVHGQSFARAAVTENLAVRFPEPVSGLVNIGLLHTSLTGRAGHENYAPCTMADLKAKGYDYWALGHVHRAEVISTDPPIIFSGCIQGRHIRENGPRGCTLVTIDNEKIAARTFRPLDVIRWETVTIDLTGTDDEPAILASIDGALGACLRRNTPLPVITRIILTGNTCMHASLSGRLEYWREAVRSTALTHHDRIWVEKVIVRTRPKAAELPATLTGPMEALAEQVATVTADETALGDIGRELNTLFRKLPAAYRQGDEALHPGDPTDLRRLVAKAKEILTVQLTGEAVPGEDS